MERPVPTTKQIAQDKLMQAMQVAFDAAWRSGVSEQCIAEMDKQFKRVEKLFGYEQGSWSRGV